MGGSRGKLQRAGARPAGRPRGVSDVSPPDPRVDFKRDAPAVSPPRRSLEAY